MTAIRRLHRDELGTFVEKLWLPFSEEMEQLDAHNQLIDDRDELIEKERAYRRERLNDDSVAHFVATREGTLLGYTCVEIQASPPIFQRGKEGMINDVYVRPPYRGEGIGSDLMEEAERWSREQGADRIVLSVNPDNQPAVQMYRERGYTVRRQTMEKIQND